LKGSSTNLIIVGALSLGEFGKMNDLKGIKDILNTVSSLFKSQNEEVKTAGSICLGNISVGNPDFFLS
jgi:hypothetical protein